jgi:hypothetical protein
MTTPKRGPRVLVCGGRDWTEMYIIAQVLDRARAQGCVEVVIEGECKGADQLARGWAANRGVKIEPYPADWERFGRSAGPIRNAQMIEEGKPDWVCAFDTGGEGTADMIEQALAVGLPVLRVDPDGMWEWLEQED